MSAISGSEVEEWTYPDTVSEDGYHSSGARLQNKQRRLKCLQITSSKNNQVSPLFTSVEGNLIDYLTRVRFMVEVVFHKCSRPRNVRSQKDSTAMWCFGRQRMFAQTFQHSILAFSTISFTADGILPVHCSVDQLTSLKGSSPLSPDWDDETSLYEQAMMFLDNKNIRGITQYD